jgi:hypothetical protein
MAPGLPAWLFEKRFRLGPFIDNIDARRIFPGVGQPNQVLRRRWRLLRKFIASSSGAACGLTGHGLETTTSDLGFVLKGRRRPRRVESEWRIHGRAVLSRAANVSEKPVQPLRRLYWGGAGSRKIAFWEKLISTQAGELAEVRRLAGEVSRRTGRVVLSWHNASLGAAGGWAFEETAAQFDSPELYGRFVRAVREEAAQIRKSFDFSSAMDLFDLRADRIFAPKLVRAVEHSQICANFAGLVRKSPLPPFGKEGEILGLPLLGEEGAQMGRRGDGETKCSHSINAPPRPRVSVSPRVCVSSSPRPGIPASTCHLFSGAGIRDETEWPGALSPHQMLAAEQVRAWIDKAREGWTDGLILLFALANQGRRMLDSGKIDSLVLPWIDKFFISSRRRSDGIYLERLLGFVSSNMREPLILFWEDTARREAPSLGLALEDLAGRGLPVRGIGIFGPGVPEGGSFGAERANALQTILDEYPEKALFALRPLNENHCPDAFRRVFKDLDMRFFLNYDSSWKDNLAFIYAGTQVFPLLSEQVEMECISPWVCAGRKRFAFGAWLRRMLRGILLGDLDGTSCPVCLEYSAWANLL